jgi:hypothetical protein
LTGWDGFAETWASEEEEPPPQALRVAASKTGRTRQEAQIGFFMYLLSVKKGKDGTLAKASLVFK